MDIMTVLGLHFPNVQAHCEGVDITYENLVWESGDPLPPKETLEQLHIQHHKEVKIRELSELCGQKIVGGFQSSALGAPHVYDSQPVDQLNLVGSWLVTTPDPDHPDGSVTMFAARPIIDGVTQLKEYKPHDQYQLKKIIIDGVAFKLALLQRFNELRNYILATELSGHDVDAINWDTVIPA